MRRRGQTEMIGVVFIAVMLIVGVLIYARMSSDGGGSTNARDAVVEQEAESFIISLLAADVEQCGTNFEGVARACLERDTICDSADPCGELQDMMTLVAGETLTKYGTRYNLSVEGTGASVVVACNSSDRRVLLHANSRQEIIGSGGMPLGKGLVLGVCR